MCLAVNIGKISIDGPNMKGLLLSVMIGKFGKIMECIKTQSYSNYLQEMGSADHENEKVLFRALH